MNPYQQNRSLVAFCPAKVNLTLAITGKYNDGYHELISLVAPLQWGDSLWARTKPYEAKSKDSLTCSNKACGLPLDSTNLILRAAQAFREFCPLDFAIHFHLEKRIPIGAGLGGGSSNAAAALRLINSFLGKRRLPDEDLRAIAAGVGSDCPLFINPQPALIQGRGEQVELLTSNQTQALLAQSLLLFKPHFPIATPWAYQQLKAKDWTDAKTVWKHLKDWQQQPSKLEKVLCNDLQKPVFRKYLALPILLEELQNRFDLDCQMTGSGSTCFALLKPSTPMASLRKTIQDAWGKYTWIKEVRIGGSLA